MAQSSRDGSDVDRARRYFLKAAAYAAPAIVATVQLRSAHAQPPSCMPVQCNPACAPSNCMPVTCMPVTCMPVTG